MLAERRLIVNLEENPPYFLPEQGKSAVILSADTMAQAKNLLGQEFDWILYDGRHALNLDALAIAAGTLRAGGTLVLWLDKNQQVDLDSLRWSGENQAIATPNFTRHFYQVLERYFPENQGVIADFYQAPKLSAVSVRSEKIQPTSSQEAIIAQMLQSQADVCVLIAKRGRGKSALVGLLAKQLWAEQPQQKIWLTAPNKSAVKILQDFAETPLLFVAPDALYEQLQQHSATFAEDWLFIDEAAMIPLPLLFQLTAHFKRIVCTTTIHSYEGTGRGFLLKFLPNLHRTFQQFELTQPLRWAENDKLEAFIDDLLLLNAENQLMQPEWQAKSAVKIFPVSQAKVVARIAEFYGLLTSAHYRTSPLDLRRLFDAPKQQFWLAEADNQLVGAVWLVEEGGLQDAALIQQICGGKRRPKGNLVAQKLAHEQLNPDFLTQRSLRISRIAILPEWQGQGVGQAMMEQIVARAEADFLSVSFGYTPELAAFWQKCGFVLAYLGENREASSGCYSAMALCAKAGNALAAQANRAFERDFSLRDHPLKAKIQILNDENYVKFEAKDLAKLQNFVENDRTLASALPAIRRFLRKIGLVETAFFATFSTMNEKKAQVNALREAVKSLLEKQFLFK